MRAIHQHPNIPWDEAMSIGQLRSKLWLIDELVSVAPDIGDCLVVAGWVGVLPFLMFRDSRLVVRRIASIDIDPECEKAAETLNRASVIDGWRFKAFTDDAMKVNYMEYVRSATRADGSSVSITFKPQLIINTSWEHFPEAQKWLERIPSGTLLVLQASSDSHLRGHINAPASLVEFQKAARLTRVLLSRELGVNREARFLTIGYK